MKIFLTLKVPLCITKGVLAIIFSNTFWKSKVDQKKTVADSQLVTVHRFMYTRCIYEIIEYAGTSL